MKIKILSLVFSILMITSFFPLPSYSANDVPQQPELKKEGHRVLRVTVTEIKGDSIFYKTEEDTTRNFSVKLLEKNEKVRNIKIGDQLEIEFDEGNQVVRIDRAEGLKPTQDPSLIETVAGQVIKFDASDRILIIKQADGTIGTFKAKEAAAIKLAALKAGTNILLEIDNKNNLVEDFEQK